MNRMPTCFIGTLCLALLACTGMLAAEEIARPLPPGHIGGHPVMFTPDDLDELSSPRVAITTVIDSELPFKPDAESLEKWRAYLEAGGDAERVDKSDHSALMYAALEGNAALVELLIKHGADVNRQQGWERLTPLMWAACANREVCELLVSHGAKLDALDKDGNAAFHYIRTPDADLVQFFLDRGTDINSKNGEGDTLLMTAAKHSPELVKTLLAKGADVAARGHSEATALHMAVVYLDDANGAEMVRTLLDAGADVNAQNRGGTTALYACVLRYHINMRVFQLLLDAGADVNLRPEYAHRATPLHAALGNGHADAAMKLLDAGADVKWRPVLDSGTPPLFAAAEGWCRPVMERLIEMGEDIHEKKSLAVDTLLMAVAEVGDVETAKWLIAKGMDINERSLVGKTAVMRAVECGQDDMVRFLVELGADLTKGDANQQLARGGYTSAPLLNEVVKRGDVAMCRYLVKHGADFDIPWERRQLLHFAVESESPEMCQYVLNFNTDADVRDNQKNTPLHLAAAMRNAELCALLLEEGANVNVKNMGGETPLACVANPHRHQFEDKLQCVRVWQMLVAAGADVAAKDLAGRTVLDYVLESREGSATWAMQKPLYVDDDFGFIDDAGVMHLGNRAVSMPPETEKSYETDFFLKYVELSTGQYRNAEQPESLFMAAHEGDTRRVALLLDAGQDVNRLDRDGETALHFAVRAGNAEMVTFLLDRGADVNAAWHSPLHYAAGLGEREIVELLIKHGASVEGERDTTPLFCAVAASHGPCVTALVKHGANPVPDRECADTPFHKALRMRNTACCKFFCQNGFDLEAYLRKDTFYRHFGFMGMTPEYAGILLECGMDINARDRDGATLLHFAVALHSVPLVAYLMEHGADPAAKDFRGLTPAGMTAVVPMQRHERRRMETLMENEKRRTENE